MTTFRISMLIVAVMFGGCAQTPVQSVESAVDAAINEYHTVKFDIRIGMTLEEYAVLMDPIDVRIPKEYDRPPIRFSKDKHIIDILFVRSGRIPDGEGTDDEFTPYIFQDGRLAAIGWEQIGGMKRTSQDVAAEQARVTASAAGRTVIKQTAPVRQSSQRTGISEVPMMEVPQIYTPPVKVRIVN